MEIWSKACGVALGVAGSKPPTAQGATAAGLAGQGAGTRHGPRFEKRAEKRSRAGVATWEMPFSEGGLAMVLCFFLGFVLLSVCCVLFDCLVRL